MSTEHTLRDQLDYLVRRSGKAESELLAEALRTGVRDLFEEELIDAYLQDELGREALVAAIGEERVRETDYARDCLQRDVNWGLRRA
jgi:hypothetical protein